MIDAEVADLLEFFAEKVIHIPGVSRTHPHAFAEAKSDLRGEMLRKAADLRGATRPGADVRTIQAGERIVASRRVPVVSKTRRP